MRQAYLEFGGKLYDENHAPGFCRAFQPDSKLRMLLVLKDGGDVHRHHASRLKRTRCAATWASPTTGSVIRLIDIFPGFRALRFPAVLLTRFHEQALQRPPVPPGGLGIRVYHHYEHSGYPSDAYIVSPEGFGRNVVIVTTRSLVVVTAPGPGSGQAGDLLKPAVPQNVRRATPLGYAKFETFPSGMCLPPANLAYEAATADLNDVNMIDPFHLEAYGITTVNYNRDVEAFPVLVAIFEKILGKCPYKSPTDMGVNMVGNCIVDDEAVRFASRQEIIRRFYVALCEQKQGKGGDEAVRKLELLMKKAGVTPAERKVVAPALQRAEETGAPAAAMELPDGTIVTGKTSDLLGASSALLLNALKKLAECGQPALISPCSA